MPLMEESVPWAWRFDSSSSAGTASLGPSAAAAPSSSSSTNPLYSFCPSTSTSSSAILDSSAGSNTDLHWRQFSTRHVRKRRKTYQFSSDDDDDGDKLNDKNHISCSRHHDTTLIGPAVDHVIDQDSEILRSTRSKDPSHNGVQGGSSIPSRALASASDDTDLSSSNQSSYHLPLTIKETERLISLIKMVFRFEDPKMVRRARQSLNIGRGQDARSPIIDTATNRQEGPSDASQRSPPDTSQACTQDAPCDNKDDTSVVADANWKPRLKAKYLPTSSPSSSSRASLVCRIQAEDQSISSSATRKLRALLPIALPLRSLSDKSLDWVIGIALESYKDGHGNVILPDRAYIVIPPSSADHAQVGSRDNQDMLQTSEAIKEEKGGKGIRRPITIANTVEEIASRRATTRSARRHAGLEAPAIPLPSFWRRKTPKCRTQAPVDVDTESVAASAGVKLEDALTALTPATSSESDETIKDIIVEVPMIPDAHVLDDTTPRTKLLSSAPADSSHNTLDPPIPAPEAENPTLTAASFPTTLPNSSPSQDLLPNPPETSSSERTASNDTTILARTCHETDTGASPITNPTSDSGVSSTTVRNLSKILAQRNIQKIQQKELLLRTHKKLLKPRSGKHGAAGSDAVKNETAHKEGTDEASERKVMDGHTEPSREELKSKSPNVPNTTPSVAPEDDDDDDDDGDLYLGTKAASTESGNTCGKQRTRRSHRISSRACRPNYFEHLTVEDDAEDATELDYHA